MSTAIQLGWLIGSFFVLDYAIKHLGARKTHQLTFGMASSMCLWIVLLSILRLAHLQHTSPRSLMVPGLFSVLATIFGAACWTVWKQKRSGKAWAIAACLMFILMSIFTISFRIHSSRSLHWYTGVELALGVTGLVAFSRRDEQQNLSSGQIEV